MNKFIPGDKVRKTKGSEWSGTIVGTYSTELTPEGYCVESDKHKGSVQIYPAGALEIVEYKKKLMSQNTPTPIVAIDQIVRQQEKIDQLERENVELKEQLKGFKETLDIQREELAKLREDKERLDWLAKKCEVQFGDANEDVWAVTLPRTNNQLREAIDAAKKGKV